MPLVACVDMLLVGYLLPMEHPDIDPPRDCPINRRFRVFGLNGGRVVGSYNIFFPRERFTNMVEWW